MDDVVVETEALLDFIAASPRLLFELVAEVKRLRQEIEFPSWRISSNTSEWPQWAQEDHRHFLEANQKSERLRQALEPGWTKDQLAWAHRRWVEADEDFFTPNGMTPPPKRP